MGMSKKIIFILGFFLFANIFSANTIDAEEPTPTLTVTPTPIEASVTPTPDTSKEQQELQNKINDLEGKIKDLQGQQRTLSSQISVMDNQIKLTELRINATKQQIENIAEDIDTATKKIEMLEEALAKLTKILMNRIVATYEVGTAQPFYVLLSSDSPKDFLSRVSYLKVAQENDKKLIFATQQAKNDYVNQKTIFEDKKKKVETLKSQLEAYTKQLNIDKQNRQRLFAETQGSEASYQRMVAQAKAQLSALSSFATARFSGGAIIPHAELSDGWGKYYNQRDSDWGNIPINGQSGSCDGSCTMAKVGCLATSYAMVSSHYGDNISPGTIAVNSSYFWPNTALFNRPGPSAGGRTANAVGNPSFDMLRNELNAGNAVIAGLSYDGGSWADHWVVLRSVDGDTFRINDPLYPGAMNVSLNDNYKGLRIVDARIYR